VEQPSRLKEMLSEIGAKRQRWEAVLHGHASLGESFSTSIARQRVYLLWTAALSAIHLLEIWVLVRFHFAFPPTSGLNALRVISSLSLLGLFAALSFRWADFDAQTDELEHTTLGIRLSRISEAARMLLILAGIASLLIAVWVILFSRLDLLSPAAFRAVVFSGIFGLPFDVTSSFLLYVAGSVSAIPIPKKLRLLSLGSSVVALFFLALDLPLVYLAFSLFPRLLLLKAAWTSVSGAGLRSLLLLPHAQRDPSRNFKTLFRSHLFGNAASQILFDLGFLFLFNRLNRFEAGISLLLYLVHKSAHLSMVLFGKAEISFSSELKNALLIGEALRVTTILRSLSVLAAFYLVIGFSFTPLFILQRQAQAWLSPTGEPIRIDFQLLAIGFLIAANCLAIYMAQTLASFRRSQAILFAAILFFALGIAAHFYLPLLVYLIQAREALLLTALAHTIIAISLLAFTCWSLSRGGALKLSSKDSRIDLAGLLNLINTLSDASDKTEFALFWFKCFKERPFEPDKFLRLEELVTCEDRICFWGPHSAFALLKRSHAGAFRKLQYELAKRHAGNIERLNFVSCAGNHGLALLNSLFRSASAVEMLYELGANKRPAPRTKEAAQILEQLASYQKTPCDPARLKESGIKCAPLQGRFSLENFELELRISARQYLRAMEQTGDFLQPNRTIRNDLAGFLHLNRSGRPALLLYIPLSKRELFASLRYDIFCLNLDDALGFQNLVSGKVVNAN